MGIGWVYTAEYLNWHASSEAEANQFKNSVGLPIEDYNGVPFVIFNGLKI